ncbi:MAG: agarase [Bacteroidota bacterium]|jgi:hypothetical protein
MRTVNLNYLFFLLFCVAGRGFAQPIQFTGTHLIETKEWSRDSLRRIQYSNWKTYPTHSVDQLAGYRQKRTDKVCIYGGDVLTSHKATGFFYTLFLAERWIIVDPDGHEFIVTAVNSIRLGKSPRNEEMFAQKFQTSFNWMQSTVSLLNKTGFNMAGSWSADEDVVAVNHQSTSKKFSYTTQLGLLAGYIREAVKLDSTRKGHPAISFILDAEFAPYCQRKTEVLKSTASDPALFGHFSDNEIAFLTPEIDAVRRISNPSNPVYVALLQYCQKNNTTPAQLSVVQKQEFIGEIATVYFNVVATAIKQQDPNHLYIGSRIHAAAKNNPFLLRVADRFVDIHSINYYGYWELQASHRTYWSSWMTKPFFITEFYTKATDAGLANISGAGWLVHTQNDRGLHYQNFCLQLLAAPSCVGWHWFRYQDNDPTDLTTDPSNNDSNKGIVNNLYEPYPLLVDYMKELNLRKYSLRNFLLKSLHP